MVKLLIDYANKNKIILIINEENHEGSYAPIVEAINNNNLEIIKLLIDYANKNKIILKINEKDLYNESYPLLHAVTMNNIEIIKLLIDYANKNDIILEINENNEDGYTPVFGAINNSNIDIFKLLINYGVEKNNKLIINENDIKKVISKNLEFVHLKNITKINIQFLKLITLYKSENKIEIIYSKKSKLSKLINEIIKNEKNGKMEDGEREKESFRRNKIRK